MSNLSKRVVLQSSPVVILLLVLSLCVFLLAGCGDSEPDVATSSVSTATEPAAAGSDELVLEVVGPEGTRAYTLDEIKAMKSTEGYGGMKSSTGHITPPTLVKGVLIEDLFAEVGGTPADMAVNVVAKDGYEMTVSVEQLTNGDFLTYDMATGAEKQVDGLLQTLVAYEVDGKPIDPDGEGPLRLAIVGAEMSQVTDGHWWVKWVTKLQTKAVEEEWTLLLTGALTEEMDRATFQTGAAEGCHGRNWTDAEGNTWTGIPLYLLVGRVDDEIAHEGPAYNRDLAEAGYDVEMVSAGSGSIVVSSKTMYYNKDLIVAYRLNDEELPEQYWPLRLVGEGVEEAQTVGGIGEIRVLLPAQ